jgi:phage shock protein A
VLRKEKQIATAPNNLAQLDARKNQEKATKSRSSSFSRIDSQFHSKKIVAAFSTTMSFFS